MQVGCGVQLQLFTGSPDCTSCDRQAWSSVTIIIREMFPESYDLQRYSTTRHDVENTGIIGPHSVDEWRA